MPTPLEERATGRPAVSREESKPSAKDNTLESRAFSISIL